MVGTKVSSLTPMELEAELKRAEAEYAAALEAANAVIQGDSLKVCSLD